MLYIISAYNDERGERLVIRYPADAQSTSIALSNAEKLARQWNVEQTQPKQVVRMLECDGVKKILAKHDDIQPSLYAEAE